LRKTGGLLPEGARLYAGPRSVFEKHYCIGKEKSTKEKRTRTAVLMEMAQPDRTDRERNSSRRRTKSTDLIWRMTLSAREGGNDGSWPKEEKEKKSDARCKGERRNTLKEGALVLLRVCLKL